MFPFFRNYIFCKKIYFANCKKNIIKYAKYPKTNSFKEIHNLAIYELQDPSCNINWQDITLQVSGVARYAEFWVDILKDNWNEFLPRPGWLYYYIKSIFPSNQS